MADKTAAQLDQPVVHIAVSGYKSIRQEQQIDIRPLTILAGANSSGKSSIMQPLLLLKQTLEASYDPGPLLLDGPNVRFNEASQLFFTGKGTHEKEFRVTIRVGRKKGYTLHFAKGEKRGLNLSQMDTHQAGATLVLTPKLSSQEIIDALAAPEFRDLARRLPLSLDESGQEAPYEVVRNRCFLELRRHKGYTLSRANLVPDDVLRPIIHLPGLRGNPTRTYPVAAVGRAFPGAFEDYIASIIARWQNDKNTAYLQQLGQNLHQLGLTWKVEARPLDDTKVELRVGRTLSSSRGGAKDMVNVADVGFGVSQTLPVLVALLVARPGQIVYLEQPEIHLHPRAQDAMAGILADAARRGVRVVVETHSSILLLAIQTLVANAELSPDLVALHWFRRDDGGETYIESAKLDQAGAFGDWPEDFGEVTLNAEQRYLDAAEAQLISNTNGTQSE